MHPVFFVLLLLRFYLFYHSLERLVLREGVLQLPEYLYSHALDVIGRALLRLQDQHLRVWVVGGSVELRRLVGQVPVEAEQHIVEEDIPLLVGPQVHAHDVQRSLPFVVLYDVI